MTASSLRQKARHYRQFQKDALHKGRRWTPGEDARITAVDPLIVPPTAS
jgi:hypothetical protein